MTNTASATSLLLAVGSAQVDDLGCLQEPKPIDGWPITVYPPNKRGYQRFVYYVNGRRKESTSGRTYSDALLHVAALMERIDAHADKSTRTLNDLLDAWTAPDAPRARPWGHKHAYEVGRTMDLYVRPSAGGVVCGALDKQCVRAAVQGAPTKGEGDRVRRMLRTALRWGQAEGYLTTPPETLLGNVYWQHPSGTAGSLPTVQGADPLWVPPQDIPDKEAVAQLAHEFLQFAKSEQWWALYPHLAAYSGARRGELFALRASDVDLTRQAIDVRRQVTEVKGEQRVTAPKGNKVRRTAYPKVCPPTELWPDGYPLAEALAARVEQVRAVEPDGLLFPAPRGGMWRANNFYRNRFHPAAARAKWPTHDYIDSQGRTLQRLDWTWHSLRHVFCTHWLWDKGAQAHDVANLAGHSSPKTTLRIYARNPVDDSIDRILAL